MRAHADCIVLGIEAARATRASDDINVLSDVAPQNPLAMEALMVVC
jgi:hypothetical protein